MARLHARAGWAPQARGTGAAMAVASLVVALATPAAAPAADRVIRSQAGLVSSVGPLKPTDAGVARLTTLFGRRTAVVAKGNGCTVRFSRAHITVVLANFGGGGSACQVGRAQRATVNGREWRTQRGLRVGDRSVRMKRLYPGARRRHGRWELQTAPLFGLTVATLEAVVARGRVARMLTYLGGAGE